MDELLSEKEQIEVIRDWWKENGTFVIAGIVLGVGGIFGFNQWRSGQAELQLEASVLFEELAEEVAENRVEPAETLATEIYTDYAGTIYADQARLAMARLYMDQGRDQDAADALRGMLETDANPEMQLVARLRLAKILLYQGRPEEVLALLEGHTDSGFAARYNEALGDAHFELGEYAEAETAYLAAVNDPSAQRTVDSALLQMKINDLPEMLPEGESATPDAAPAVEAGDEGAAEDAGEGAEAEDAAQDAGQEAAGEEAAAEDASEEAAADDPGEEALE